MFFGQKSRQLFRRPELVAKRHPRTRCRNGAIAATKQCETSQNVSLGPKVVDCMCFDHELDNSFVGSNSWQNGILGPDVATVHLRQPNGAKPPKT